MPNVFCLPWGALHNSLYKIVKYFTRSLGVIVIIVLKVSVDHFCRLPETPTGPTFVISFLVDIWSDIPTIELAPLKKQ